ncbi:MAG: hypothetical protein ABIT09_11495 [Croceibacterium sp.]
MADTPAKSTTTGAKHKTTGASGSNASHSAAAGTASPSTRAPRSEARSRFNSALDEARAGVAALGAEARDLASDYGSTAKTKGGDYADQLKTKAGDLAVEGKARASDAISGIAKLVGENAATIEDKLGAKYADYARTASKSLQDTATKLDDKSVEELGQDAREYVRKSPGTAVGLAALAGFLVARLLRGK